jgi:hypothetical protein
LLYGIFSKNYRLCQQALTRHNGLLRPRWRAPGCTSLAANAQGLAISRAWLAQRIAVLRLRVDLAMARVEQRLPSGRFVLRREHCPWIDPIGGASSHRFDWFRTEK